jgi:ABC-type polysaccharide transport system permease subunit
MHIKPSLPSFVHVLIFLYNNNIAIIIYNKMYPNIEFITKSNKVGIHYLNFVEGIPCFGVAGRDKDEEDSRLG